MNVNTSIYNYHNNAIFKRYYSMKQKIFIVLFLLCSILTGCLSASAYYYPDTYYNSQGENYLQITKIEHALFNRSFENESIYARLNRIEQKLFRATNNSANLADRLEAIMTNINPSLLANIPVENIKSFEKTIFRRTFTSEAPDKRISRLEQAVFGTLQPGSLEDRYEKLQIAMNSLQVPVNTYQNADNTYSNNRFKDIVQNVLGGIGTITGVTTPVYDPFETYSNAYYPGNCGYNRFYRNNNSIYNSFKNFGTTNNLRILD